MRAQRPRGGASGARQPLQRDVGADQHHVSACSRPGAPPSWRTTCTRFSRRTRDRLLLVQGLADATMAHDEAWQFLTLGMYLERADNISRLLERQCAPAAADVASEYGLDTVRWLAVLRSAGSAEAYARYYSLRVDPVRVLEFLLLNPIFPQAVSFSLSAAWRALQAISQARACILRVHSCSGPPARFAGARVGRRSAGVRSRRLLAANARRHRRCFGPCHPRIFSLCVRRRSASSRSRAPRRSWPPISNSNNARRRPARHAPGVRG